MSVLKPTQFWMIKIDPSDHDLKVLIKIKRKEKTRGLSSHSMGVSTWDLSLPDF